MQRHPSKKRTFAVIAASVFSVGLGRARADTPVSWANPSSNGNWSNSADWNPEVSPNGAYSVTLPTGSETVTLDVSPTIDSLTLDNGATLQADSGTSLTTGSLADSGQLYFASGGALTVIGTTVNSGLVAVYNSTTMSITGNLTNSNSVITGYAGRGTGVINVSGTFNNTSNGSLSLQYSNDVVNVNTLNNQGSIGITGGATLNITGGGQGVTDVTGGTSYSIAGNFNVINSGVTTSALANLASVEGDLYLENGQTYNFGPLTNSGLVAVYNSTTMSITGNLTNSNSVITGYAGRGTGVINVSGTFNNTSNGSLSLQYSNDVVNVNTLNNQGSIGITGGATLNITGGGQGVTDVTGGTSYSIAGNFNVINSGVTTSALANLASVEGDLYLENGQTYNFGPLTNSGLVAVYNSTTMSITGNLTNSNSVITGYAGRGTGVINVSGTFNNTSNGSLSLQYSNDVVNVNTLNNQGSIGITGGATLNITGGGQGVTDVTGGTSYSIAGNFNVINSGVTTSALANLASVEGDLYLENGQTYNFGPLTNSGLVAVYNSTTMSITGNLTNSNSVITGYAGRGTGVINVSGTFNNTSNGSLSLQYSNDVVNVNTLNNQGSVSVGSLTSIGTLPQKGAGSTLLAITVDQSGGTFSTPSLSIGTGGTFTLGGGQVTGLSSLIINGGKLDITNRNLFIKYGSGPDPIASIAAWIISGYADGSWNGLGIDSSAAAVNNSNSSNPQYGIGYADSADPGNPAGLASGQIEIAYTLLGDANLDDKVNGTDFNLMATNFNQAVTNGWDKGDFNYDGKVNGNDFVLLAANFNQFASQSDVSSADLAALDNFAAANGISLTTIPEPATLATITLAGLQTLRRRRRNP